MKKIFALAVLASAAVAASAAGVTGTVQYEYDTAEGAPFVSVHTGLVGLKYKLPGMFGSVDASAASSRVVTNTYDSVLGYELGYSNGVALGPVSLTGRVAYRTHKLDNLRYQGVTINGKHEQVRLGAEAGYKLSSTLAIFGGYDYIDTTVRVNGVKNDDSASRFSVGTAIALTDRVSVRGALFHTNGERNSNGVITSVSYAF